MGFGKRLRDRRMALGLSQEELARDVGTTQMQIWRYENGKIQPNAHTLIALAQRLSVSTDYLLGLVDDPNETLPISDVSKPLSENERLMYQAIRDGLWDVLIECAVKELREERSREKRDGTLHKVST